MAECYDPRGNQDETLFPCSNDGNATQCCTLGYLCASNGLCVANSTQSQETITPYFINGCTDQDWIDGGVSACPAECIAGGGVGVAPCDRGTFCCYGFGGCDCSNSTQVFSLGPVNIVATITGASSTTTSTTTTSTSTTSTSTHTSTATSSTSPTPTSDDSSSNNLPVGLGVGLGVGIPVLIGILAGVFFLLRRRRKAAALGAANPPAGYQAPTAQVESDSGYYQSQPSTNSVGNTEYFKPHGQTAAPTMHELPTRQEAQELQ
ncbi:hypothetical protein BDW59DRAFT_141899 [Aspergillus cavernicola]|uniref:Mid2 domain-containing protein n=1 Tax=Aspergillus cavernicola TaxID=176166 RepID=A0ABR4IPN8_9EURO